MSVPKNLWRRIKRYPNVVGYSSQLQPRIRAGKVIPEEKCIRVYVKKKLPLIQLKPEHVIPREIDGVPVDVVEIGEVRALSVDRTKKFRPLVAGVSIGHYKITAGCLTKDTLVLGNPGAKPITEFKEGDMVYVFSEDGAVVRRVKRFYDNGEKDVYLIVTQTGREIKATDNHPFLVIRRIPNPRLELYEKALRLWSEGRFINDIARELGVDRKTVYSWINGRHKPSTATVASLEWVPLRDLKPGDYIVVLKERPFDGKPMVLPEVDCRIKPNLPRETNEDLMWFFGYYLADGSISVKEDGTERVTISEGNPEKAKQLISMLEKYGIPARYYEERYAVEITSTYLARLLKALGLTGNTHTKTVPSWVFGLPKSQIEAFIKGFIFGDGCRHKSRTKEERYDISSCNERLLRGLMLLAQMVGWRTTRIRSRRRISYIEGRKVEGTEYSLSIYIPSTEKSRRLKGGMGIGQIKIPEPFGVDRIVEIRHLGRERVYDLEIDGEEHNFIANNIVVHNSLGWFAKDNKDGEVVMLSNNHVFANENNANIGDPILQPGPYDGGKIPDDVAGYLKRFIPIKYSSYRCPYRNTLHKLVKPFLDTNNLVDAAVATLKEKQDFYEILELKPPLRKLYEPSVGLEVVKSGRTTGVTKGTVFDTAWSGYVFYSRGVAFFTDQVLVQGKGFSQGGDSGSLVMSSDRSIVGLLFAGSDEYTVVNKLKHVEDLLGISLLTVE
jgi:intein/homing endonuclease